MKNKIDFVLIWVDGSDKKWQEEKIKYSSNPDSIKNDINRYRDWGLLKYWFRGVEKFAPWVNNVYFITCGHYPEWLNLNHPKLKFLKHEDYIPKEYLPTFNCNPIELNFHRIEGLSENFVYFNDDTFLIKNVSSEDFFKNNKPRYVAACDILNSKSDNDQFIHILLNDLSIINSNFDKRKAIMGNCFKWFNFRYGLPMCMKTLFLLPFKHFSNFVDLHIPSPLKKSTIKELWEKEKEVLEKTSSNKFRSLEDVNQYLFKWYDIARGNFESFNPQIGKYFSGVSDGFETICNAIEKQKYKMICFSDDLKIDFESAKNQVSDAFEKILPEKSGFEK